MKPQASLSQCPNCRGIFHVASDPGALTVICPQCSHEFLTMRHAPTRAEEEANADAMPTWLVVLCLIVGHCFIFLVLSIVWSAILGFWLIITMGVAEIAYWSTRPRTKNRTAQNGKEKVNEFLAGLSGGSAAFEIPIQAEIIPELNRNRVRPRQSNDVQVEIQAARAPTYRTREATIQFEIPRRKPPQPPRNPLGAKLPVAEVQFYGLGTRLDLGRGLLESPFVYASGMACQGRFDASLIDTTLDVAAPNASVSEQLSYWPSYYESSPTQRSKYLQWLLSGRKDPGIDLGYVFIYYYGLERRALLEQRDHVWIANEVMRLLSIYNYSNSFRSYATDFLWLCLFLASQNGELPPTLLHAAILATNRWSDDTLSICLAVHSHSSIPLRADLAFVIAKNDPRAAATVIVRRHGGQFQELFARRFAAAFGAGMTLKSSRRTKKPNYRPASGSLIHNDGLLSSLPKLPDVLSISSQFKPLVGLWNDCVAELKDYSRIHRDATAPLSAEAYEALPIELRKEDHPEFDAWMDLWQLHADVDGWPLVPIAALAELKGIQRRETLTTTQCEKILATADALGIGVVPDARFESKNYRWKERVSFFFLETDAPEDASHYHAAAILLRLGLTVAEADGELDTTELNRITRHLEGQFNLTENQSKRLEQLKYLLLHSDRTDNRIGKFLSERLTTAQRRLVGEFLVGIAAADEIVSAKEVASLKRAYRTLDLEESSLDELLASYSTIEPTVNERPTVSPQDFKLDMQAVSRIMTETREVARILSEVMTDQAEETGPMVRPIQISPPKQAATSHDVPAMRDDAPVIEAQALAARYQPFLQAIVAQSSWRPNELIELSRKHNVMLNGAIEAINEWATEQFGDWLVEEGETYVVHKELIKERV